MKDNLIKFAIAIWIVIVASVYLYYKEVPMAVTLKNDRVKVIVDADKCGRLMYLGTPSTNYLVVNTIDSNAEGWVNFGGSYLWVAPQDKWVGGWPPPAELDGIPWQLVSETEENVIVRSKAYKGLILERRVSLDGKNVVVENIMYNNSDDTQVWGFWSISQVPMESKIEFDLAVNDLKVYDYPPSVNVNVLKDAGVLNIAGKECLFNTIIADKKGNMFKYKLGGISNSKALKVTTPKGIFYKSVSYDGNDKDVYPHGSNVEIYTEGSYVEVETLGKMVTLKPGKNYILKTIFIVE